VKLPTAQYPILNSWACASQLIENLAPLRIDVLLESQDIFETNAPVRPHQSEGKLFLFKQPNKEQTRHTQEIGGLLCRKLGVLRDDGDRSS
jgi:hypothetical protein